MSAIKHPSKIDLIRFQKMAERPFWTRDSLHQYVFSTVKSVENIYPILKKYIQDGWIKSLEVINKNVEVNSSALKQPNIQCKIFVPSMKLYTTLGQDKTYRYINFINHAGQKSQVDIRTLRPYQVNSFIFHDALNSQFLNYLYKFYKSKDMAQIHCISDFLLKRCSEDLRMVPDGIVRWVDKGISRAVWVEVERSKKKNIDLKKLINKLCYAANHGYLIAIVAPSNYRSSQDERVNHIQRIKRAAEFYASCPLSINFYDCELLSNVVGKFTGVGGKSFRGIGQITVIPSYLTLLASHNESQGWSWAMPNEDGISLLYRNFSYYLNKVPGGFEVADVIEEVSDYYGRKTKREILDKKSIQFFKDKLKAHVCVLQFIEKRYGKAELLRVAKIYSPQAFKEIELLSIKNKSINAPVRLEAKPISVEKIPEKFSQTHGLSNKSEIDMDIIYSSER